MDNFQRQYTFDKFNELLDGILVIEEYSIYEKNVTTQQWFKSQLVNIHEYNNESKEIESVFCAVLKKK